MDRDFWLDRWRTNEIGFHASAVQPALTANWPALELPATATVLVPLAGKSLDLIWLRAQGHAVVGAELSRIAVDAFFAENGFSPVDENRDGFVVKSHDGLSLWCGDYFALRPDFLPPLTGLYDRAALVAMPPELQPRYVAKTAELLAPGARGLLIGLDYDPVELSGPPFNTPQQRVAELYAPYFDIKVLDVRDGLAKSQHLKARGVTHLEEATYLIERRP